ncbi:SLBB domain-containing protein [Ferrimonas pelagia]|uniref:SLBB domain-containing protein n=1 Tax=Ferrimonas pelagia TaxID=1177826 RepID=A0ABP9FP23_9GAMM
MKNLVLILLMVLSVPVWADDEAVLLQAGDNLQLSLPGESDFDAPFQLDQSGRIYLPEIGPVLLQGKTLSQAKQALNLALSMAYRDLADFDVRLLERQLLVSVLGYVRDPGEKSLPADANVQTAINRSGGLVAGAQLNRLQLRRNEEVIEFDYKAYLDKGEPSLLPELQSGDIVFVPVSPLLGNVQIDFDAQTLSEAGDAADRAEALTLFGEVRQPGTFSFKPGMGVVDALMRAEGVTRYGDVTRIRVITRGQPTLFDLKAYLDNGDESAVPAIGPGSMIYVPTHIEVVSKGVRTMYVMGEVQAPGAYEASDNINFIDILANAGGPTRFAETKQIRLIRANGEVLQIDLQAYTENTNTQPLPEMLPGDVILVPEKTDMNEKSWLKIPSSRAVKIIGAVRTPGRYEWDNAMSFLDLLAHAGGPEQHADLSRIEILHEDERGGKSLFNLDKFINQGGEYAGLPQMRAGDTVVVNELPWDPSDNKSSWIRQSAESSIYVFGQVGAPGRYAFTEQLGFLDILSAADGPNPNADLSAIRINHRNSASAQTQVIDLALYFETGDETMLPVLKPGDSIYIPARDRAWLERPAEQVVRLMGSVHKPGRYEFNDSMTVLDLLAEAGGPKESALIERIIVVQHSCCDPQAKVFDLQKFVSNPSYDRVPVLRPGDTVYVPDQSQSNWRQFMNGVKDALSIVTLAVLGAAI